MFQDNLVDLFLHSEYLFFDCTLIHFYGGLQRATQKSHMRSAALLSTNCYLHLAFHVLISGTSQSLLFERGLEFRPQMFGSFLQKEVQLEVLCATIFTVQVSLQYHGQEVSTQSECPFCLFDDNCYHSLEGHQLIKAQDHVDSHLMC